MNIEELLKDRYKVIADYPGCPAHVGNIFQEIQNETLRKYYPSLDKCVCSKLDKYPHLFRKLEWWEERKVEEMPEYIAAYGRVIKVNQWGFDTVRPLVPYFIWDKDLVGAYVSYANAMPATESEYLTYITSTK